MFFRFVILAGGKGTRMKTEKPKALVKLKNKELLGHIFSNLGDLFFLKPVVVIGYKGQEIVDYLKDKAEFVWQKEQLGTGHALLMTKDFFANYDGDIVVLYGDQPFVSTFSIKRLIQSHRENSCDMTFFTVHLLDFKDFRQNFYNYGRILRNKNGDLLGIKEMRDTSEKEKEILEVNPGIYCFSSRWLWKNLNKIENKNAQNEFYLTDILKIAIESKSKIGSVLLPDNEALGANTQEELSLLENM